MRTPQRGQKSFGAKTHRWMQISPAADGRAMAKREIFQKASSVFIYIGEALFVAHLVGWLIHARNSN
jgi:hypothetical protein